MIAHDTADATAPAAAQTVAPATDALAPPAGDAAEPGKSPRKAAPRSGGRDARIKEGNVGSVLRSVYQQTVNEDVPDDLMQLLGKLS